MTTFEFVFSLFGLLLGFTLVEVLKGFATALHQRDTRIGWLTPLLAVFVMLDVLSFWSMTWVVRDAISPTYGTLFIGFIITAIYYVAASLIFPETFSGDLDAHYFRNRQTVLGAVWFCNFAASVLGQVMLKKPPTPSMVASEGIYSLIVAAAVVSNNWRVNLICLTALIVLYGFTAAAGLLGLTHF